MEGNKDLTDEQKKAVKARLLDNAPEPVVKDVPTDAPAASKDAAATPIAKSIKLGETPANDKPSSTEKTTSAGPIED